MKLDVAAVRAGVDLLQDAAEHRVFRWIFAAVVDLHRVMIHRCAALATNQGCLGWFLLAHSEMFSRP